MRFNARELRKTIVRMAYAGSTVHIGCAFSIVEILAVLYRSHLRLGAGPGDPGRDYLVLSKGHGVMAQYACPLLSTRKSRSGAPGPVPRLRWLR